MGGRKKKSAAEPSQLRREPCRECDDSNRRKQGSSRGRYLVHDSNHDSDAPVRNSCFTRYLATHTGNFLVFDPTKFDPIQRRFPFSNKAWATYLLYAAFDQPLPTG